MNQLKIIFSTTLIILISGCSWHGYIPPNDGDFSRVSERADAYEMGIQNFDTNSEIEALRLKTTKEAFSDVQQIVEGDRFAKIMSSRTWAEACDQKPIVQISGEDVVRDMRSLDVKVSIFPKKPFRAVGLTDLNNYRIAIDPTRMDQNSKGELIAASYLIETVAHEFSHLVINENGLIKYRDQGHGKKDCTKNDLVSYRVGRAVQAIWISDRLSPHQ